MHSIHFAILPPPAILKNEVECVRIADYRGEEAVTISGMTPTRLAQQVDDFYHEQAGHAFV